MTEFKHTPGPWKFINELASPEGCTGSIITKSRVVCDFVCGPNINDAKLIAAAPDLLEALIGIQDMMGFEWLLPEFDTARDAIAKALGKG